MRREEVIQAPREHLVQELNDNGIVFDDSLADNELRDLLIEQVVESDDDSEIFPDEYFN